MSRAHFLIRWQAHGGFDLGKRAVRIVFDRAQVGRLPGETLTAEDARNMRGFLETNADPATAYALLVQVPRAPENASGGTLAMLGMSWSTPACAAASAPPPSTRARCDTPLRRDGWLECAHSS